MLAPGSGLEEVRLPLPRARRLRPHAGKATAFCESVFEDSNCRRDDDCTKDLSDQKDEHDPLFFLKAQCHEKKCTCPEGFCVWSPEKKHGICVPRECDLQVKQAAAILAKGDATKAEARKAALEVGESVGKTREWHPVEVTPTLRAMLHTLIPQLEALSQRLHEFGNRPLVGEPQGEELADEMDQEVSMKAITQGHEVPLPCVLLSLVAPPAPRRSQGSSGRTSCPQPWRSRSAGGTGSVRPARAGACFL